MKMYLSLIRSFQIHYFILVNLQILDYLRQFEGIDTLKLHRWMTRCQVVSDAQVPLGALEDVLDGLLSQALFVHVWNTPPSNSKA